MQTPFRSIIEIPARLQSALALDYTLSGEIQSAVDMFSVWIGRNQTVFFPEYTDHGIDHVKNVLNSAERLIPERAWQSVTPADAAAIIASVLLHDCAMHLTLDGFFELVDDEIEYKYSKIHRFGRTWSEEFQVFQQEAARWDAGKLMSVFGDQLPAELLPEGCRTVSDRQKLLVGEFLRRHHARVAHQIAQNWVPGPRGCAPFSPLSPLREELRDLYGFIAFSHNIPIRAAADMLQPIRRRIYMGVHAPFVMAVLRIADYIQIDAVRAPTQILQLRGLKSPVSRTEWAKHGAVLELHQSGDDPEALNVIADPKSVEIFSGLRLLFSDLQRELDESWATLGEVYGRFDDLKALGLTVRRLASNLDDPADFEEQNKPPYIPRELRLSTASAELLDLLVGPLYGNRPSVGVRELLQNSVDAVLERASYESRHGVSQQYHPNVSVTLKKSEGKTGVLQISDNGVGMTLDTIDEYFLRAGASFRKSQWWKSEFVGDEGKSNVRRSGRFGVGVLAAFLIGRRITVTTRHFMDHSGLGLTFTLEMGGGLIEVARTAAERGTTITINLHDVGTFDKLSRADGSSEEVKFCDWFLYDNPAVTYSILEDDDEVMIDARLRLRSPLISSKCDWVPVCAEGFAGVYWSYAHSLDLYGSFSGFVACNGIFISTVGYGSKFPTLKVASFRLGSQIRHPALLVDDPDGRFPLNIQRNQLAEKEYPFQIGLERSIAEVYARTFYLCLKQYPSAAAHIGACSEALEKSLRGFYGSRMGSVLGLFDDAWVPLEESLLHIIKPKMIVYEMFSAGDFASGLSRLPDDLCDSMLLVPWVLHGSINDPIGFVRGLLDSGPYGNEDLYFLKRDGILGYRFFVRTDVNERLNKKGYLPKFILNRLRVAFEIDEWVVYDVGEEVLSIVDTKNIIERVQGSECSMMCFVAYSQATDVKAPPALSPFASEWVSLAPTVLLSVLPKSATEDTRDRG